jgi:hypothetical protein
MMVPHASRELEALLSSPHQGSVFGLLVYLYNSVENHNQEDSQILCQGSEEYGLLAYVYKIKPFR